MLTMSDDVRQTNCSKAYEDEKGKWVEVSQDVVRHAVRGHRGGLRGEVAVNLVERQD